MDALETSHSPKTTGRLTRRANNGEMITNRARAKHNLGVVVDSEIVRTEVTQSGDLTT